LIEKLLGASGGSFVRRVDHHAVGTVLGSSLSNVMRLGTISQEEVDRVRLLLETPAAAIAAEERDDSALEVLESIVRAERASAIDSPSVSQLDIDFHSAIAEASGNRVLAALIRALHQVTRPVAARPLTPEIAKRTLHQHDAIVAAIRDGDGNRARAAMSEHLVYLGSLPYLGPPPPSRDGVVQEA
jgi:GntR family transcriptional regulator, transcriptional repressor for pyruvate dehydrogenase complex